VAAPGPDAGASVSMTVYGWGLGSAASVTLVSQNGGGDITGSITSASAGWLSASFAGVPLGAYQVEAAPAGGTAAVGPGDFVVVPGVPLFKVTQQSFFSMAPGYLTTYRWRVENDGPVAGVALVLVRFPDGMTWVPDSADPPDVLYSSSNPNLALVEVPVEAGLSAYFSFDETLPPSQVLYPGGTRVTGSANWPVGAIIHTAFFTVGGLTQSRWGSLQNQQWTQMVQTALADTMGLDEQYQAEIAQMPAAGQSAYRTALDGAVPGFAPVTSLLFPNGTDPSLPQSWLNATGTALSAIWNYETNFYTYSGNAIWNGLTSGQDADSLEGLTNGTVSQLTGGSVTVFNGPSFGNQTAYNIGNDLGQLTAVAETTAAAPEADTAEAETDIEETLEEDGVGTQAINEIKGYFNQFNEDPSEDKLQDIAKEVAKKLLDMNDSQASQVGNNLGQLYQSGNLVVASEDPNAIAVFPPGTGPGNYVLNGQTLNVQVQFENSPQANAPARNVEVDVQLGPNLDPGSVQLLNYSTAAPPLVSVTSGGLARFFFNNINLPPDTSPPAGQGSVEFAVSPLAGLADNAPLTVSGNVYFDYNPPVATQSITYEIDAVLPAALVSPLPATSPAAFTVDWSGSDPGGPGVANYTVLVSVDGGSWQTRLAGTTATSAVYDGQPGYSYSFVALATDLLGQTQVMPAQAQASTAVAASSTPSSTPGGGGGSASTPTAPQLAVSTATVPAATAGLSYIATIATNNEGTPPYTFAVTGGTLPAGLTLAAATGVINGTATAAGTYIFTVTVKDAVGNTASQAYTLTVNSVSVTPPAVTPPPVTKPAPVSFSDIATSWAKAYILHLAGAGVINGYPDGTFRPDNYVARVEFVKMLVLADKLPLVTSSADLQKYTDFASFQPWELPYLATAVKAGIINGYPNGTLQPGALVDRIQMAAMVGRTISGAKGVTLNFRDDSTIPTWGKGPLAVDVAKGLINGLPNGTFGPDKPATRAQAAKVLAVYMGL
jgi:hypothetical protein